MKQSYYFFLLFQINNIIILTVPMLAKHYKSQIVT